MNHEPTRCLRPDCRFSPLLGLTEIGGLEVFAYCSIACKEFTEASLVVARSEPTTETERRSHQLILINELLNLRAHAAEYDEAPGLCGVLDAGS
ncbi:hypothetical protein OG985_37220 [Streptomyces sp. NBC_00289]|uniref:hypothetical protein n=1 Tax=Streptomyces sp. NBC_00289 TaxID=2975703 RepID=UPI00324A5A5D